MKLRALSLSAALFALVAMSACGAVPTDAGGSQEASEEELGIQSQELNSHDVELRDILKQCSDVSESCCGLPGDRGNPFGVGKFCLTDKQCRGNWGATTCSSAENAEGDHKSFFCTIGCDPNGPAKQCVKGASCACEENGACGCAPNSCINNPPDHCEGV